MKFSPCYKDLEFDRYILEKTKCKDLYEKSKPLSKWLAEDKSPDSDWKIPKEILKIQQRSILPESYTDVSDFLQFWDEKYRTPKIRGDPVGKAKTEL